MRLDWFTQAIIPDGRQICAIRPTLAAVPRAVLSEHDSALLQTILTEVAQDPTIPFAAARQAVLRAFMRVYTEAGAVQ